MILGAFSPNKSTNYTFQIFGNKLAREYLATSQKEHVTGEFLILRYQTVIKMKGYALI